MCSLLDIYLRIYSYDHFPGQDLEHFHQSETSLGTLPNEHPSPGANHYSNFDHLSEMCNK